ncbi:unnamed protein product [Pseudo-nitzschia multistriata]|uniref:J domain-containing protein n=1 Tax=Pseudo-nitzschia multistriata TaxID=183589 RepID=A0A448ZTH6_9STRA|nr:unnamed protein product [Pseudo-nitzschia multistriata]
MGNNRRTTTHHLYRVLFTILVAWSTTIALCGTHARADSLEDEYVRQVIEEDQQHYNDYHTGGDDDDEHAARQQQQQQQRQHQHDEEDAFRSQRQRMQEEREAAEREAADRMAAERERQFEAEVQRMNEEQRKLARKQKKIDGRVVKSVLRASGNKNLYAVLGIRHRFPGLKIPAREVDLFGALRFTIPGISLFSGELSEKQIRKQFRKRAMEVHPDKNRDGRAQEAFVAVEEAAAVLSDPRQREAYDAERARQQKEQLERYKGAVKTAMAYAWALTRRTVQVIQTLLGPFFVPVAIILALII